MGVYPIEVSVNYLQGRASLKRAFTLNVSKVSRKFYYHTGREQTFEVPPGGATVQVELWGAGGGLAEAPTHSASSGAGGYTVGTWRLESATSLIVVVGGGGQRFTQNARAAGGFGGGGASGLSSSGGAAGGGGFSGVFIGCGITSCNTVETAHAAALAIAGGGGGGYYHLPHADSHHAGAGGGVIGQSNAGGYPTGGQQDTGGLRSGTGGSASTDGSMLQGGVGGDAGVSGGGGGGGYYGGGGAAAISDNHVGSRGGGAGGSGYVAESGTINKVPVQLISAATYAGDGTLPPAQGRTSPNYPPDYPLGGNLGHGQSKDTPTTMDLSHGFNGLAVITLQAHSPVVAAA